MDVDGTALVDTTSLKQLYDDMASHCKASKEHANVSRTSKPATTEEVDWISMITHFHVSGKRW